MNGMIRRRMAPRNMVWRRTVLRTTILWAALVCGLLWNRPPEAATFRRGDANVDSRVDASDAVKILDALFGRTLPLSCVDALDANDDGAIDVSDPVYVLLYLFSNGAPPNQPFPDCGDDPTQDGLDCAVYDECVECETQSAAEASIAALIPRATCVPEDAVTLEFDAFLVTLIATVCPSSEAGPCGPQQQPGCGVGISTVAVDFDLSPAPRVVFTVTGGAVDLPVTIGTSAGGIPALCLATIPFSVQGSLPLVVADAGGGAVEVLDVGEPAFDGIDVDVLATGGVICEAVAGLKDLIIGELEAQAEAITESVVGEARDAIVGRVICP